MKRKTISERAIDKLKNTERHSEIYAKIYEQRNRLHQYFEFIHWQEYTRFQEDAFLYTHREAKLDVQIAELQKKPVFQTSFLADDLFFIVYLLREAVGIIKTKTSNNLYTKEKETRKQFIDLLNLINEFDNDRLEIKSFVIRARLGNQSKSKIFRFTSDEIKKELLPGLQAILYNYMGPFDEINIAEKVKIGNKNLYKKGRGTTLTRFLKLYSKSIHTYIKNSNAFVSKDKYTNIQMKFIAELFVLAGVIEDSQIPEYIRIIRNYCKSATY